MLACLPILCWAHEVQYHMKHLPRNNADTSRFVAVTDLAHGVVEKFYEGESGGYDFWSPETGYLPIFGPKYEEVGISAMNVHDQVVGWDALGRGVLWTPRHVETFAAPAGYVSIRPQAIDDSGRIVGYVVDAASTPHSFHRSADGELFVDRPGQAGCTTALNDRGDVIVQPAEVGQYTCWCSQGAPPSLVRDHVAYPIQIPGQDGVCIQGLDEQGEAAVRADPIQGFWSLETGFVPIEDPDADYVIVGGIASGGIVTGTSYLPGRRSRTFLWNQQAGMRYVEDLLDEGGHHKNFYFWSTSPHGVLGVTNGATDLMILVPSRP